MVSLGNPDIINNESQKKQQMPESVIRVAAGAETELQLWKSCQQSNISPAQCCLHSHSLSWLNLVHCFPSLFPSSTALPLTSGGYCGVWGELLQPSAPMSE